MRSFFEYHASSYLIKLDTQLLIKCMIADKLVEPYYLYLEELLDIMFS